LPKVKQDELQRTTDKICELVDAEKAILFGPYARGNWVEGPHRQGKGQLIIKKKSDYDIHRRKI